MDAIENLRLVWVHRWLVLVLSALGALAVAVLVTVLPPTYSSTAIIRVVPPTGALDVQALSTAVSWYVSLGQVPTVLRTAGDAMNPPLSPTQVEQRTELDSGSGPGEITVKATGSDPQSTQQLATLMSQSVLAAVTADPELRIGNTSLQNLVPASTPSRSGPGAVPLAVATFLLLLVLLISAVALLGRRVNWRLSPAAFEELGSHIGMPAFRIASTPEAVGPGSISAAAALGPVALDRSIAVVPVGAGRDGVAAARTLAEALSRLGLQMPVVEAPGGAQAGAPAVYAVGTGGPDAVAAATRLTSPVALAVARGTRSRAVMRLLGDLQALELEVVALLMLGADRGRVDGDRSAVRRPGV